MTDDIPARLHAGADEDERIAQAALSSGHLHDLSTGRPGCDDPRCAHDRRHPPARALRQVQAIRRLIRLHDEAKHDSGLSERYAGFEAGVYAALELLAPIYPEGWSLDNEDEGSTT